MPTIKNPELMKTGIRGVLMGLVMTGICAGAWFMYQDRYWTAQKGPTEVAIEQIARLENPDQLPSPWVRVTFDKVVDTGLDMLEVSPGIEKVDYQFLLCQAGDRWMVAAVPEDFRGNTLSGQIYHSTVPEDIEAFVEIHSKMQDVHGGRLFPFEFRADIDFGENWTWFAYIVGGFGLLGLVLAGIGVNLIRQAFQEPGNESGAYGSSESFDDREEELEEEWEESRA